MVWNAFAFLKYSVSFFMVHLQLKFKVIYYKSWCIFFSHVQFMLTVLELGSHLNPTLLTVSHMDKGCSQKGFPIYSDMAWNIKFLISNKIMNDMLASIKKVCYLLNLVTKPCKSHLNGSICIVNQDVQSTILFRFYFFKESSNFFIFRMVTLHRDTFSTPGFDL